VTSQGATAAVRQTTHGPGSARPIFFTLEQGKPRVVGLVEEG
jgi:hypothetical protein